MNRLTKRCLAVFVSAICVKYSGYTDKNVVYGAENDAISTTDENLDSISTKDFVLTSQDDYSLIDISDSKNNINIEENKRETIPDELTNNLDDEENNEDITQASNSDDEYIVDELISYSSSNQEIDDNLTEEEKAVLRINLGIAEVYDYTIIGIRTVNDINFSLVNSEVKNLRDENGSDFTKGQIKTQVNTFIKSSLTKIRSGNAEIINYTRVGVDNVNEANLSDVNYYLKGKACTTGEKVKTYVNKILDALFNINAGSGEKNTYQLMGIYNLDTNAIPAINEGVIRAREAKGSDLNRTEIIEVKNQILQQIDKAFKDINDGVADVSSYLLIGVENGVVNDNNISDINEYLTGKKCYTLDSVRFNIDRILGYIKRINEGTETINDYREIGIEHVTEDSLDNIRILIAEKKSAKGSDLNKSEIQEVVASNFDYTENAFDMINSGNALVDTYLALGITEVNENNIDDVNNVTTDCGVTSITEVKEIIYPIIRSLNNINSGNDTADDYMLLEIDNFDSANIDAVREAIRSRERYLNVEFIKGAVDEANNIVNFFDILNTHGASVSDYEFIGAVNVENYNLSDINNALKNQNYKTLKKVQLAIDTVALPLIRINEGAETLDDYFKLSLHDITNDNLESVRQGIQKAKENKGNNLNIEEIQNCIDKTNRVLEAFDAINYGSAILEDFNEIGAVNVTDYNISYILDETIDKGYSTLEEVQAVIDKVNRTLEAYENMNNGNASISDYEWIGANGVTEANREYVNRAVMVQGYETVEEIQDAIDEIIDLFRAFTNINSGNEGLEDFETIGVAGVTDSNLPYVIRVTQGKRYLTVEEVQAAVDIVISERNSFANINAGIAELSDYDTVGVRGVTEANKGFVNGKVQGQNFIETAPLQDAVTNAVILYNAFNTINNGTESLNDFAIIGVNGVTENNKIYVDRELTGKGLFTTDEVQAVVTKVKTQREALARINDGQGSLEDYVAIGASKVTDANKDSVNAGMAGSSFIEIDDAIAKINSIVRVYDAYYKINKGRATVEDYEVIGVTGVDSYSLLYVNVNLRNKRCNTLEQVQARVDMVLETYQETIKACKALDDINAGNATVEQYDYIGIDGVTADNVNAVNDALKGQGYKDLDDIQSIVDSVINA